MAEPEPPPAPPSGDDKTTTTLAVAPAASQSLCPVCWTPFTRAGRQLYCTDKCRKTAWTRRRTPQTVAPPVPPARQQRDVTIYACPTCEQRYHAQQWCPDCNQPCTRVGLGGPCPHCDEPVAIADLLDPQALP